MFFKIAVFSLLRHGKRTLLVLAAVALSVIVMELVAGMFEGMRAGFFRNLTSSGGHAVVRAAGWEQRLTPLSIDFPIEGYQEAGAALRMADPAAVVEPVLSFGALLLHGEDHYLTAGHGVLPEGELFRNVREGIVAGSFLPDGSGAVVSRTAAGLLDIELGAEISLLVEDSTGSPYYLTLEITGIFATGAEDFDSGNVFISHRTAEELLYLENATTEIRIRLDRPGQAEAFAQQAGHILGSRYDVRTWRETEGSLVALMEAMDLMILVMDLLVIIVAASVITNALLMNMFDRMGEYGTLRAIGLKKRQLFGMIMTEGALQGAGGGLIGLLVGVPLVIWLSGRGLDFGSVTESLGMGSSLFYFAWNPLHSGMNAAAGILTALAGSLYAARTALGMSILKTLNET